MPPKTHRFPWRRLGGAALLGLAGLLTPADADAWYFPEHAEITRIALTRYAPHEVTEALEKAIHEATQKDDERCCGARELDAVEALWLEPLPLCAAPGMPFHETPLAANRLDTANITTEPLDNDAAEPRRLTTPYARCISYGALTSLAGDHAVDFDELRRILVGRADRWPLPALNLAGMVVGTAVESWGEFRSSAPADAMRFFTGPTAITSGHPGDSEATMNRRKLVRDLDARLEIVDHDYSSRAAGSRAHFNDSTRSIGDLLEDLVRTGNMDNSLAQMITHHMRSLVLALQASALQREACTSACAPFHNTRARVRLRMALLEHAMAVHFLEDGFSAGHMGTEHGIAVSFDRLQRHDYLDRRGLPATRALSEHRCASIPEVAGKRHCWTAYGDGYLAADDLDVAAEAVARMQMQFALALTFDTPCPPQGSSGDRAMSFWNTPIAQALLDPEPAWTHRGKLDADDHLKNALDALADLRDVSQDLPLRWKATADSATGAQLDAATQARDLLGHPARACPTWIYNPPVPTSEARTDLREWARGPCQGLGIRTLSTLPEDQPVKFLPGPTPDSTRVSTLWRAILVTWPVPQSDVTVIDGRDPFGHGVAFQAGYAGRGGFNVAAEADTPGVFGLLGTMGLSYRADSLLPGRDNRAVAELNVGMGPTLIVIDGQVRYVTVAMLEARAPIIPLGTLAVGYLSRSADAVAAARLPFGVGIYGVRFYGVLPSGEGVHDARFYAWDVEVANMTLGTDPIQRGASKSVAVDSQLRLRIGRTDLSWLRSEKGDKEDWSTFVDLEFAGGFSWFL